jgi:hypothetical protein
MVLGEINFTTTSKSRAASNTGAGEGNRNVVGAVDDVTRLRLHYKLPEFHIKLLTPLGALEEHVAVCEDTKTDDRRVPAVFFQGERVSSMCRLATRMFAFSET